MIFPDDHPRIQYLEKLEQAAAGSEPVEFQLPPPDAGKPIGGHIKMLHGLTKENLNNPRLEEAVKGGLFKRDPFKYQRPTPDELVGDGACEVLKKFWRDELNGAAYGTGFGLLYDMMVGRVDVKLTPGDAAGEMKVLQEVADAAPAEAAAAPTISPAAQQLITVAQRIELPPLKPEHAEMVIQRVRGNINQAIEFLMENNDPEKLQKVTYNACLESYYCSGVQSHTNHCSVACLRVWCGRFLRKIRRWAPTKRLMWEQLSMRKQKGHAVHLAAALLLPSCFSTANSSRYFLHLIDIDCDWYSFSQQPRRVGFFSCCSSLSSALLAAMLSHKARILNLV